MSLDAPVVMSPKVEAYGENEDGTLFYAEATLYDYLYDYSNASEAYDTGYIYLDTEEIDWGAGDAYIMAWIWGNDINGRYVHFVWDSTSQRHRIPRMSNYTGMQLYRFAPNSHPNDGSTNFDDQNGKTLWHYQKGDINIPSDKNMYRLKSWDVDSGSNGEWEKQTKYYTDNQHAYRRNSDGVDMSEEDCHNLINGDRWMTGLQVPYEHLNRKLSSYYSGTGVPALYLGNFYGTATNLSEVRGNGINQTPWQYTYKTDQSGRYSYADVYNNFWESANAAPLNNNGNVAIQGLVDRKLSNGNLTQGNGSVQMPLFSDSFINANSTLMQKYPTSNGFPFNIIKNADGTKTYKFDSAYDAPRYYRNGAFYIGTLSQNGVANWRSDGNGVTAGGYGFFPFNSSSITDTEVGRQQVNYGFGMKVNIPFNLSENGTILDKNNNEVDVVFEFSGDDDVWVFVDGILMLDLGGDHAKVQGSINFNRNKQSVWIDHASTFNRSRSKLARCDYCKKWGCNRIRVGYHRL